MFNTMLVIVLHAKHLPLTLVISQTVSAATSLAKIISAYSITSCFHTDVSSRVKPEKIIRFLSLNTNLCMLIPMAGIVTAPLLLICINPQHF